MGAHQISYYIDCFAAERPIIAKCCWMNATGLDQGTSGNISARHGNTMLISPSATPYDTPAPDMIAAMPIEGEYGS